jgi:hypothetical protein
MEGSRESKHFVIDSKLESLSIAIKRVEGLYQTLCDGSTVTEKPPLTVGPVVAFQMLWEVMPERVEGFTKRLDEVYIKLRDMIL